MKKAIVFILLVILTATAAGFGGAWHNTKQDLEDANGNYHYWLSKFQYESNLNLKLQKAVDKLTKVNRALRNELDAKAEPALSTVVGQVYADANYNQALDWRDHKVAGNISGFKVVLYTTERRSDGSFNHVEVASTTVTNGEYRFVVNPGEYFIGVSYSENQLYNRRYNHIIHINGGNMIIGTGETVIGPTILLADNGLG